MTAGNAQLMEGEQLSDTCCFDTVFVGFDTVECKWKPSLGQAYTVSGNLFGPCQGAEFVDVKHVKYDFLSGPPVTFGKVPSFQWVRRAYYDRSSMTMVRPTIGNAGSSNGIFLATGVESFTAPDVVLSMSEFLPHLGQRKKRGTLNGARIGGRLECAAWTVPGKECKIVLGGVYGAFESPIGVIPEMHINQVIALPGAFGEILGVTDYYAAPAVDGKSVGIVAAQAFQGATKGDVADTHMVGSLACSPFADCKLHGMMSGCTGEGYDAMSQLRRKKYTGGDWGSPRFEQRICYQCKDIDCLAGCEEGRPKVCTPGASA